MSTVRIIRREERLRVVAQYDHSRISYEGDIFQFIEQLQRERLTGKGEFTVTDGAVYGLTFDRRDKKDLTDSTK